MKYFRYQAASLLPGRDSLKLLNYIGQPFCDYSLNGKIIWHSYPDRKTRKVANYREIVDALDNLQFNSIEIRTDCNLITNIHPQTDIELISIQMVVSPFSRLWKDFVIDGTIAASNRREYMSLNSWVQSLKYHGVKTCPTVYECTLGFKRTELSDESIIKYFLKYWSEYEFPCSSIASLDYGNELFPLENYSANASRPSKKFEELGVKFDGLHRLMLMHRDRAKQLSDVLKIDSELYAFSGKNEMNAAVILKPELISKTSASSQLHDFIF